MHKPTDTELSILQLLWERGALTVREVNELQNSDPAAQRPSGRRQSDPSGEVGYTTTLKIMQIMHEKGLVTRTEDGRTHRYASAISETSTKQTLLQNFVDNTFRGSAMQMVLQALGHHEASPDELEELKALIESIERKNDTTP
jgi:BlaI family transcriptional regulator, penicillinase repressor